MYHSLIFNIHAMGSKRPPGAHRIASFLREHEWDVEVIDYATEFNEEELKELVRSRVTSKTIFIGFSTFFAYWNDKFDRFVDWIKKNYPNISLILGGQSRPRIKSRSIDYYVHGFGEYAILALVRGLIGNSTNGIIFDPLFFGDKKVISANTSYPAFPMKSLKIKYEDRDHIQPWEWLTIEFGRGCKFKCAYCNFPNLGVKGDHTRTAEDFEDEMRDNYDRWGVTQYYVADETFNDRSEKIEKFAKVADQLNFKPYFSGFVRADLMIARKDKDWDLMNRLGFFGHFYGVETMNSETGKAIGKGMHPEKLQEGLIEAKKYFLSQGDYRSSMGIVVGLPYETIESQMNTLDWVNKNWQGECVHVWPLEIPIDPKQDVLSEISKNYEKFGYRQGTKPLPPSPDEFKNLPDSWNRIKHGISNLNWENDNMSFSDACQISNDWYLKLYRKEVKIGISMFHFGDYMIYGNMTRKQTLEKSVLDIPPNTGVHDKFYKSKKLNK